MLINESCETSWVNRNGISISVYFEFALFGGKKITYLFTYSRLLGPISIVRVHHLLTDLLYIHYYIYSVI